ncbi:MAG: bifunctional adenosylcobinamide kinase/adenosylcobinamide-phosphate guanylyltransferase [Synergistaceae bacterium]|nr:bifunctional adenosylcobinamide kinase/adenosylcobinamide-phosphate guanylyltransferase [Synergistaceae bacterium]
MKPVITLVIGGARSGKSSFAQRLAAESGTNITYVATADAGDPEMAARINDHRERRPKEWKTWEGNISDLPREIKKLAGEDCVLMLDCLTMYITGLFLTNPKSQSEDISEWSEAEEVILDRVREIFSGFMDSGNGQKRLIAVSNEVGSGVVPAFPMGRRFRDLQGRVNQIAAKSAHEVALIVAGIPLWLKSRDAGDM